MRIRSTILGTLALTAIGLVPSVARADSSEATKSASPESAPVAPAPEPDARSSAKPVEVHYDVEAAVGTTFVARGIPQYATRTDPASLNKVMLRLENLGPGALTVGTYSETALVHPSRQKGAQLEYDPIAFYGIKAGEHFRASAGYFMHVWPGAATPSTWHEAFATVALDKLVVRPALAVYYEFIRANGAYATAGLSKTFTSGKLGLTLGAQAGVHGYDGVPFALREVTASVGGEWKFADPFYVSVRGAYSYTGARNYDPSRDSFLGRSAPVAMLAFGASR
jgi:hypothetical protein